MTASATTPHPMVETARLRLRLIDERDAAAIACMMTPAVSRWLASWPSPITDAAAATRVAQMRGAAAQGRALCFAIERRHDGAMMGCVTIVRAGSESTRGDLGYWLGERYQGQGYMSEAAAAAVAEGFARFGLEAVEAGAQPGNTASFGIMRKLGMHPIGERLIWASARGREETCAYHELTREAHAAHVTVGAARRA